MDAIELPALTRYLCLYSRKGRARYLDMHRIYIDGSFDDFAFASINLDDPIVLLDPQHSKASSIRPYELAKACDLFIDECCYRLLKLTEDEILRRNLFDPADPICFAACELDQHHMPSRVISMAYNQALAFLQERAEAAFRYAEQVEISDPTLRAIFVKKAAYHSTHIGPKVKEAVSSTIPDYPV